MGIWEIVVGAFVLLFSVVMIIVIILQEGHEAGLGTITGGADSFLSRGKARTADAIFARVTKYCAIFFFILIVLLNALQYFGWTGAAGDNNDGGEASVAEVSVAAEDEESTAEESVAEESAEESSEVSVTAASEVPSAVTSEAASSAAESETASSTASEAASSAAESETTSSTVSSAASAA